MKLMHLADLHLGKALFNIPQLPDQRFVLEQLLDRAVSEQVDAIVLAGDIFDKASPSAEAVELLDWLLTAIEQRGLACIGVPGNHDSAERIGYASSLLARHRIHLAGPYRGKVECVRLKDGWGTVAFWLFPFMRPAQVKPYFSDEDIKGDYTTALAAVVETCAIDPAERNVAVAHQFVASGSADPERSDSELAIGGVDRVASSVFDPFDYVALGHLHHPQQVGRDTMRYAGSPLMYSLSELAHPKTTPIVTLKEKGSVSIELVPIEPLRPLRRIRGPLDRLVSPEIVAEGDPNDYLHVVLTDEAPAIDALARVRSAYPYTLLVEYDNVAVRARRQRTLGTVERDLDPVELFERFFEQELDRPLDDDQRSCAQAALERAFSSRSKGESEGDRQ